METYTQNVLALGTLMALATLAIHIKLSQWTGWMLPFTLYAILAFVIAARQVWGYMTSFYHLMAPEEYRLLNAHLYIVIVLLFLVAGITLRSRMVRKLEELQNLGKSVDSGTFALALLQAAPDGIIVADPEGNIVLMNREAEKLTGYGHNELLDKQITEIMPYRFRREHNSHFSEWVKNPRIREMGTDLKLYLLHKDGREIPVSIALSPLHTLRGLNIIGIIRERTE